MAKRMPEFKLESSQSSQGVNLVGFPETQVRYTGNRATLHIRGALRAYINYYDDHVQFTFDDKSGSELDGLILRTFYTQAGLTSRNSDVGDRFISDGNEGYDDELATKTLNEMF